LKRAIVISFSFCCRENDEYKNKEKKTKSILFGECKIQSFVKMKTFTMSSKYRPQIKRVSRYELQNIFPSSASNRVCSELSVSVSIDSNFA
jgi:hypothetical protein